MTAINRKPRYVTISRRSFDETASYWYPMSVNGHAQTNEEAAVGVVAFVDGGLTGSSTNASNEWRSVRFSALQEALGRMCKLPSGHEFHLEAGAAKRASSLLALFAENYRVSPPKIIPEDGDAVAFTWDYGKLKRYLTVDEHEVDVMELHKERRVRCHHEVAIEGDSYGELIALLGVNPLSSSVTGSDV